MFDRLSEDQRQVTCVLYRVLQTHSVQKQDKKMENLGIDPSTSRMLSGRSAIWAKPPTRKTSMTY